MIGIIERKYTPNVWLGDSDVSTLVQLASYPDSRVRRLVAERNNTPAFVLDELSRDTNEEVRLSAAENPHLPYESLTQLVADGSTDVRYALAANARMPLDVLHVLLTDDNPYVACRAQETLRELHASAAVIPLSDFGVKAFPRFKHHQATA
jgi:hypothetical protein